MLISVLDSALATLQNTEKRSLRWGFLCHCHTELHLLLLQRNRKKRRTLAGSKVPTDLRPEELCRVHTTVRHQNASIEMSDDSTRFCCSLASAAVSWKVITLIESFQLPSADNDGLTGPGSAGPWVGLPTVKGQDLVLEGK